MVTDAERLCHIIAVRVLEFFVPLVVFGKHESSDFKSIKTETSLWGYYTH